MNRRLARLRAIQALFQVDLIETDPNMAIKNVLEDDEEQDDFLVELVHGVIENLAVIDERLEKHMDHWTLDRLGNVDRAVLRNAVYEMLYREDIPLHVSVNEAIEAAKAFGGQESARFANGILSAILNECKVEVEGATDDENHERS
ncbi:transcription antitermination factor NusB [Salsuginibacillus kocurii]|uniref:transcription antitermination factor NusB n=1 Tax=Salsuginibacillus kocurii TaxID=427078 RepID=UPI00036CE4DD|nr:transcription antitermination factor NusB [Salsuginibacillus kocurii]